MALIVQKYGGTSVADPDRIKAVADNVAFTKKRGHDVIVVVSAMGKATDNLIALADSVSTTQSGREMDMLLTTGERQTAALMTMALADRGIAAISFTGSQVGIITDTAHRKAKIVEVKGDRVRQALADDSHSPALNRATAACGSVNARSRPNTVSPAAPSGTMATSMR